MFVQIKRMVVTEGNANKVVERFGAKKDGPSLLEQQPGFIDKQVLVKKYVVAMKKCLLWFVGNQKKHGKIGRRALSILLVIKQMQVSLNLTLSLKADKMFTM